MPPKNCNPFVDYVLNVLSRTPNQGLTPEMLLRKIENYLKTRRMPVNHVPRKLVAAVKHCRDNGLVKMCRGRYMLALKKEELKLFRIFRTLVKDKMTPVPSRVNVSEASTSEEDDADLSSSSSSSYSSDSSVAPIKSTKNKPKKGTSTESTSTQGTSNSQKQHEQSQSAKEDATTERRTGAGRGSKARESANKKDIAKTSRNTKEEDRDEGPSNSLRRSCAKDTTQNENSVDGTNNNEDFQQLEENPIPDEQKSVTHNVSDASHIDQDDTDIEDDSEMALSEN